MKQLPLSGVIIVSIEHVLPLPSVPDSWLIISRG